ncbi:hypothetical protein [Aquiflexum sp.]|uniref:hypothetical protein n=1 Tax=Aquiflexum sp. TaxID=1872584 RepID=UPI003593B567
MKLLINIFVFYNILFGFTPNDESGVYFGNFLNKKICIILKVESNLVFGSYSFNGIDKTPFFGFIEDGIIQFQDHEGLIIEETPTSIELNGKYMVLTSILGEKQYQLKKISKKLDLDLFALFKNTNDKDWNLVGTWKTVEAYKKNVKFNSKEVKQGYKRTYLEDGRVVSDIRTLSEMKKLGITQFVPDMNWRTVSNKLILSIETGHPASGSNLIYEYLIVNDTLILEKEDIKYILIRN